MYRSLFITNTVLVYLNVQIEEQACNLFDEIMRQDRIPIDMTVQEEPRPLAAYIEDCRMKLWDHAFSSYFKGHDCFKKSEDFVGFKGTDLLIRRVLFRYSSSTVNHRILFTFKCVGVCLQLGSRLRRNDSGSLESFLFHVIFQGGSRSRACYPEWMALMSSFNFDGSLSFQTASRSDSLYSIARIS